MSIARTGPSLGPAMYFLLAFTLGAYFTFAAVQGDYGLFRRIQIDAEAEPKYYVLHLRSSIA